MNTQTLALTITVDQLDTGKVYIEIPDAPVNFPTLTILNPIGCSKAHAKKYLKKRFGDLADNFDIHWGDYDQCHKQYLKTLTCIAKQGKKF
jgi:hypothetical protein